MPGQPQAAFNPLILVKFVAWIAVVVVATLLLKRHKVSEKVRVAFIIGGVLLFGLLFGWILRGSVNPNPVASTRNLLTSILVQNQIVLPVVGMLLILFLMVWISNKSICGWGCQLGLFQDLLHRVPLPTWKPPFWLSNSIRIGAFVTLILSLAIGGLDWIGLIDPFKLFEFDLTLWAGIFSGLLFVASMFVYRPWCQFLCPFGLLGWVLEQRSVFRPRIDRDVCRECQLCVKACPTQAMADYYADKAIHADCFACGACIAACPHEDALGWRSKAETV